MYIDAFPECDNLTHITMHSINMPWRFNDTSYELNTEYGFVFGQTFLNNIYIQLLSYIRLGHVYMFKIYCEHQMFTYNMQIM